VFGLMIALLGADRRVEALVMNPPPELILDPDQVERPGLPRQVHAVALFSADPEDETTPPGYSVLVFESLQRQYRDAGILLVDWVQIDFDADLYRSMQTTVRDVRGTASEFLRAGTCL
jgi:hypothetical protein